MELTAQEYELIDRLADLICTRSAYSCMPVMEIGEADQ
jgi:hexokinase